MKINVEIDCSPEEARRFMGLPDVEKARALLDWEPRATLRGMLPEIVADYVKRYGPLLGEQPRAEQTAHP